MNVVIVENEPHIAQLLMKTVEKIDPNHAVISVCNSIQKTVEFLQHNIDRIDMIFMDIQLDDGLSFDIFKKINISKPVVFCTSYDNYTMEAFKSNGIDYILKPFSQSDIETAFEKVKKLCHLPFKPSMPKQPEDELPSNNSCLLVQMRDKIFPIQLQDIALINLDNDIVYLYTVKNEKYIISKSVDELEKKMGSMQFFRVNRQMILNRAVIASVEPYFNRKVSINLVIPIAVSIVVSRLKVSEFMKWLKNEQISVN